MNAKDQLRRYLAQRVEDGEASIVLESMSTIEVNGLANRSQGMPATVAKGLRPEVTPPLDGAANLTEPQQAKKATGQGMSDWRTALKESGAQPLTRSPDGPKQSSAGRVKAGLQSAKHSSLAGTATDPPLGPLSSLDEIAAVVGGCRRCSLYATATNPVPGEGNPNADFMVVGEAPGATEDETGRPFVGRAGQLLTQILGAIKLSREDVFICNVLKHRPPGNRNPEASEVRACSPYLIRQIELIKPKVILALGTFSAQTLLETKTSIGKLRGQIHQYHGVPVVVTYHPAALLRNPAWKRPTWEDVQLARRILDSAVPGA